ncbi:hypothetical protein MKZ01_03155 [Lysinibacillus endophyticus]|uniref:flagellin N-terminal helical domain-containing protein n=1 Tax=Ureibacillus endophyticus TaxID=1978490 RepID=UPI003134EE25
MRITHNLSALNSFHQLNKNNKNLNSTIEKLSSGLSISKASNDAAGLAISEKMIGQIRGLFQAQRNIQDGVSLVNVAEGGLNVIHAHLQRLRELSVYAANDTLTENDRKLVQTEVDQLIENIDYIAN